MRKPQVKVRARFELDAAGKPAFIDGGAHKHYKIKLFVEDAPQSAESVTYELHESYYDPLREVFRGDGGDEFELAITSYGDFDVVTTLSGSQDAGIPVRVSLAEALKQWSRDVAPPSPETATAIREAIATIERN